MSSHAARSAPSVPPPSERSEISGENSRPGGDRFPIIRPQKTQRRFREAPPAEGGEAPELLLQILPGADVQDGGVVEQQGKRFPHFAVIVAFGHIVRQKRQDLLLEQPEVFRERASGGPGVQPARKLRELSRVRRRNLPFDGLQVFGHGERRVRDGGVSVERLEERREPQVEPGIAALLRDPAEEPEQRTGKQGAVFLLEREVLQHLALFGRDAARQGPQRGVRRKVGGAPGRRPAHRAGQDFPQRFGERGRLPYLPDVSAENGIPSEQQVARPRVRVLTLGVRAVDSGRIRGFQRNGFRGGVRFQDSVAVRNRGGNPKVFRHKSTSFTK